MRYTENELRNCLEKRLKWYEEALEYRRKGIMPPIGFLFQMESLTLGKVQ